MRTSKPFGKRSAPQGEREPKRKYFLVFEGAKTEVAYFNGIIENSEKIGVNSLIDIMPLLRSYSEKDWSNPKKILMRLMEYIKESKSGELSKDAFVDRIIDYLLENGILKNTVYTAKTVQSLLFDCFLADNTIHDIEVAVFRACQYLEENINLTKAAPDIKAYIENQNLNVEENFDKICLIADRDCQSFRADQYDFVLKTCKDRGYGFYITNPCFEFWLMLHFEKVLELDKNTVFDNAKVNKTRTFLEKELSGELGGYNKSRLRFAKFKDRIDTAIANEKHFCENIEDIKDRLGCNIGLLIEELKR